jgi:hypothetical protein
MQWKWWCGRHAVERPLDLRVGIPVLRGKASQATSELFCHHHPTSAQFDFSNYRPSQIEDRTTCHLSTSSTSAFITIGRQGERAQDASPLSSSFSHAPVALGAHTATPPLDLANILASRSVPSIPSQLSHFRRRRRSLIPSPTPLHRLDQPNTLHPIHPIHPTPKALK